MVADEPAKTERRLWLVFFSGDNGPYWWSPLLKPGFRHVSAAAWYGDQQRWVHVNPTAKGLRIELFGEEEFDGRLGQLAEDAALILRIPSCVDAPPMPGLTLWCVGVVKGLLGARTRALSPWGLSRHLLAHGAEVVEKPHEGPQAATGRPEDRSPAQAGTGSVGI